MVFRVRLSPRALKDVKSAYIYYAEIDGSYAWSWYDIHHHEGHEEHEEEGEKKEERCLQKMGLDADAFGSVRTG